MASIPDDIHMMAIYQNFEGEYFASSRSFMH